MTFTPANVRRAHIAAVFHLLATGQRLSRAELGRRTGLSRTGMSQVMRAMIDAGLVRELHRPEAGRKNRQGVPLAVDRTQLRVVALDLTRPGLMDGVLADLTGLPVAHRSMMLEDMRTATGHETNSMAVALTQESQGCQVIAMGAAVREDTKIESLELELILETKPEVPAIAIDETTARLIAERVAMPRPAENTLLVTIDDDVRATVDLTPWIGSGSWADRRPTRIGDIGHISLDQRGPTCACGKRGCLARLLNLPTLAERLSEANAQKRTVILRRAGGLLGQALATTVVLLSIADVRVQGDPKVVNDTFLAAAQEYLDETCASPSRPRAMVKRADGGPEAVMRGVALAAVEAYLDSL